MRRPSALKSAGARERDGTTGQRISRSTSHTVSPASDGSSSRASPSHMNEGELWMINACVSFKCVCVCVCVCV